MNKKVFAAISLAIIAGIVIFMNVDSRSAEQKRLDAITWFIYSQTGDFDNYEVLDFLEITNDMLLQDVQLKAQIGVVQDTLSEKLSLLHTYHKMSETWLSTASQFQNMQPDQLDEWMKFNAKLDLALSALNETERLKRIKKQEAKALDLIEAKLQALNLSIRSIDLSGEKSIHYLHRFALDGKEALSVFEIDTKTDEVISYKEIG